jgi:hypothetical protein
VAFDVWSVDVEYREQVPRGENDRLIRFDVPAYVASHATEVSTRHGRVRIRIDVGIDSDTHDRDECHASKRTVEDVSARL